MCLGLGLLVMFDLRLVGLMLFVLLMVLMLIGSLLGIRVWFILLMLMSMVLLKVEYM